ncbi:SH3 domain-containing protein [Sparassis latifolia]|uniref:Protein csh3 n=1 Tax=Sparassis crispa TaxID=139825 RepID=A0A401H0F0_9APHY|nr:Protein csh3 [Sparassis crispa]GBE87893.1 Protein csh3 [Sparassis crispa]
MSTPSDPQAAALLAHVVSQVQRDVSFLVSHDYISAADAADIVSRLPDAKKADGLVNGVKNMAIRTPPPEAIPVALTGRRIPPPPAPSPRVQRAKALWAYNEDGQEPNDLSFSADEIVEILDETNTDWWTGKCRGRQGLFPSNHVEKLTTHSSPPPPALMGMPMAPMSMQSPMQPQPYTPYMPEKASYAPTYGGYPPPPPQPMMQQTPPPPVIVQTAAPPEQPKKHRFGRLGNTMANAAAGGVGFGAGAAIGGGIVDAIF